MLQCVLQRVVLKQGVAVCDAVCCSDLQCAAACVAATYSVVQQSPGVYATIEYIMNVVSFSFLCVCMCVAVNCSELQ